MYFLPDQNPYQYIILPDDLEVNVVLRLPMHQSNELCLTVSSESSQDC